jgi:hypothetical protein
MSRYKNNEAGSSEDDEASSRRETVCKNLNSENTTQNICLLESQIMLLMERKGHNVYFV